MTLESGNRGLEDVAFITGPFATEGQQASGGAKQALRASESKSSGTVNETASDTDPTADITLVGVAQVLRITRQYFQMGFAEIMASTPQRPSAPTGPWYRRAVTT